MADLQEEILKSALINLSSFYFQYSKQFCRKELQVHLLTLIVVEFSPYVFQIMSQLLQQRSEPGLPEVYVSLLAPILQPVLWEEKGNS